MGASSRSLELRNSPTRRWWSSRTRDVRVRTADPAGGGAAGRDSWIVGHGRRSARRFIMSRGIEGKVVLITGGGTGLGAETARHLASKGASVALAARRRNKLDE